MRILSSLGDRRAFVVPSAVVVLVLAAALSPASVAAGPTEGQSPAAEVPQAQGLRAQAVQAQAVQAQGVERIDFNRDIRPLLSDRCFKCHGFDAAARKASLRLDTWDGLTESRADGSVVVPGSAARSLLIDRTGSTDPTRVMPPPDSGSVLNDAERAMLRQWVEEGAPFEEHWAFTVPKDPPLPSLSESDRVSGPIDVFVQSALEDRGLSLSDEASREALIRRLSLDLVGLPPSPEEIDAFLRDTSPGAYERVVDRLLDSPHFGERMALMWLDAARYADTNGFHHDNIRTAWPYRDWVIRAFNENKPYDEFAVEQLAGDLLPGAGEAEQIATAFSRMHNINDEGGALDPEYRVEAVADRIETVSTVFMGLTFTCARCHDHKYDPFTQEDYYSLFAYFNSVDERGVYGANFEAARAYPARILYRPEDLQERIDEADRAVVEAEMALEASLPGIDAERLAWEEAFRLGRKTCVADSTVTSAKIVQGDAEEELVPLEDGSYRVSERPESGTITFRLRTEATDLRMLMVEALADPAFKKQSVGLSDNGNAVITAVRASVVSVTNSAESRAIEWSWAWADHEQRNGDFDAINLLTGSGEGWALDGHSRAEQRTLLLTTDDAFGYAGGSEVHVEIECQSRYTQHVIGRPRVSLIRAGTLSPADFPTVASDWWQAGGFAAESFDLAYDERFGPEESDTIDRNHRFGEIPWRHQSSLKDGESLSLSGERSAFYLAREIRTPVSRVLPISLGSDDAIKVYLNGDELLANKALRGVAPDQERVDLPLRAGDNYLVVKVVNSGGPAGFYGRLDPGAGDPASLQPVAWIPEQLRDSGLHDRYSDQWARQVSPIYTERSEARMAAEQARAALSSEEVPVLVMRELDAPQKTHVLTRGNYASPDESRPVGRRPPLAIQGDLGDSDLTDRLGFARWLTRADHPLFARVHVNRIWQMLFGAGIVRSAENFGQQADWPTHLGLLDWLSRRFVESGYDQKALIRRVVTSRTYRQASRASSASKENDPDNRYLSHFPRRRLQGELIRDQALFVSGLLKTRIGGPSVKPYQPSGLWREVSIGGSSNTRMFSVDSGDSLYRRSLYTFWKRTSPNPQMSSFDAPTREFCVVRRNTTNTPLQALVLWNDEQFVEASRVLAERVLSEESTDAGRIGRMFRRATGRVPDPEDHEILGAALISFRERFAATTDTEISEVGLLRLGASQREWTPAEARELAAWTLLANAVLALDETVVRD